MAFQEVMSLPEVDFILVWEDGSEQATTEGAKDKRRVFEKNLEEDGLKLERERLDACNLNFIKIHAPMEILRRYAEILKLRMPMKEVIIEGLTFFKNFNFPLLKISHFKKE